MRELIINTMAPILWVMTFFDGIAIYFMIREFRQGSVHNIPLLTGILCIGLFYDSLILASGCFLQYGTLFHHLSQLRYLLHCTLIPLLFSICAYSLTDNKKIIRIVWIISVIIMVLGLIAGIMVVTEPRTVGIIKRYASSDQTGKFSSTLTSMLDTVPVFIMIGIGIYLWIKKKNPNMFFAGFFMLLFTLLGIFLGKDPSGDRSMSLMFYISMYGEALMVFFLWRFVNKQN
ncbi:MAG: hypothetical protein IKE77_04290 [Erysipelotrichaceae bacterium]|nr:hypothetical protein [Erysipelotrichaceae bacterium]